MSQKSGEIPLGDLPMNALNQISQQLEQELELIQNSMGQLKGIQQKFVDSQECLDKTSADSEGKEILVPLTSSMYVTGNLADVDNVIVDIGTGYYVEKTRADAKKHFQKKVEYVGKEIENLQGKLQEKHKMKQAVMETLQMKVQTEMMRQQAAGAKS